MRKMTTVRRVAIVLGSAVVATCVVGLFWVVRFLKTGEMPVADKIYLFTQGNFFPPLLVVPRIYDAFFAGVVVALWVAIFTASGRETCYRPSLFTRLTECHLFSLFSILVLGLLAGAVEGVLLSLFCALCILLIRVPFYIIEKRRESHLRRIRERVARILEDGQ